VANIASIVDLVHPTQSCIGVIVGDQIWVLFDRAIDENSVSDGNFFVTGPDFDTWSGPDLGVFADYESIGSEEEILQTPGYTGILQGTVTFERVDPDDDDTTISGIDTAGSGLLYRSKAIFTPTNDLASDTEYTVYLSGDEDITDSLTTGITQRTVFDGLADESNTGTGSISFTGSYTGNASSETYTVSITTAGTERTAKFTVTRTGKVGLTYGPYRAKQSGVLIGDGVTAVFAEGSYALGDQWTVLAELPVTFSGNSSWVFQTGSGSIVDIPSTASTSILGDAVTTTSSSSSSSSFSVSSTTPTDGATHLTVDEDDDGEYTITAVFSANIDDSTVVSGVDVTVVTESVNGDSSITASGLCISEPTVSNDTLTIVVASGCLLDNNRVTVTLDETIASTAGTTLDADYSFEFTTTYDPYYCTLRKMRLEIGAFIDNVADDTINFAIFEASLMANEMTWNQTNQTAGFYDFVRHQWACCKAQEILLVNTTGGSGNLKSKKLGDLSVEYHAGNSNTALDRALGCLEKWEDQLIAGGAKTAISAPSMVVKGASDKDRPKVGRGWYTSGNVPVGNLKQRPTWSRRYKNTYYKKTRR